MARLSTSDGESIQPIERIAAGFVVALLAASWFRDTLYRAFWVGGLFLLAAIWFAALLLAVFSIWWALSDGSLGGVRLRRALAMPIALVLGWSLSGPVWSAGRWSAARLQLWRERPAYEAMAARAPGRPLAFSYLYGIPDGGVAIVRWPGDPMDLTRRAQRELTGERFLNCRPLAPVYHLCAFD